MAQRAAIEAMRPTSWEASSVSSREGRTYAALDLGTNNCRLLIGRPARQGLHIVGSFSRIVRLGEKVSLTGRLSEAAMSRTLDALTVCRDKIEAFGVTRSRFIATEACRAAENAEDFLDRVREKTGLVFEIVDRGTEACLAAEGCAVLADADAQSVILFDIGGGSSEIVCLERAARGAGATGRPPDISERIHAWISLPLGVVSLADRFGGVSVSPETFDAMVAFVADALADFAERVRAHIRCPNFHLLGTSGTVTTVAGVFLGLQRYDRRRVDGLWMTDDEVTGAIATLRAMPFEARAAHGCVGPDRADLVLAGCAILEALRRVFPSSRLRIADRGLREGMLIQMMDGERSRRPTGAGGLS